MDANSTGAYLAGFLATRPEAVANAMNHAAVRADGNLPARRAATDDLRAGKTVLVRQLWNIRALVVHVSGKIADVKCDACNRGVGQWEHCVVPDDEGKLRTKSCANCLNAKQPCIPLRGAWPILPLSSTCFQLGCGC